MYAEAFDVFASLRFALPDLTFDLSELAKVGSYLNAFFSVGWDNFTPTYMINGSSALTALNLSISIFRPMINFLNKFIEYVRRFARLRAKLASNTNARAEKGAIDVSELPRFKRPLLWGALLTRAARVAPGQAVKSIPFKDISSGSYEEMELKRTKRMIEAAEEAERRLQDKLFLDMQRGQDRLIERAKVTGERRCEYEKLIKTAKERAIKNLYKDKKSEADVDDLIAKRANTSAGRLCEDGFIDTKPFKRMFIGWCVPNKDLGYVLVRDMRVIIHEGLPQGGPSQEPPDEREGWFLQRMLSPSVAAQAVHEGASSVADGKATLDGVGEMAARVTPGKVGAKKDLWLKWHSSKVSPRAQPQERGGEFERQGGRTRISTLETKETNEEEDEVEEEEEDCASQVAYSA